MKTMGKIYPAILLVIGLLFGSNANVQAGWLLRTASSVGVESIAGGAAPGGSVVYVWQASAYTVVTKTTRGGWSPGGIVVNSGEQFVFEWAGGGNDEYLAWEYGHVGDWGLTAPAASSVSGNVSIEWEVENTKNPLPDYAARVRIMDGTTVVADLGLIWETESVVWDSQTAVNGNYTIDIKIVDTPFVGAEGLEVATITKQITVDNSGIAMGVSISELAVAAPEGSSPVDQWFEVWGISGEINYSISDDASWLSCLPSGGSSSGEHDTIIASFTSAGLSVGTHTGVITVESVEADNSPKLINVVLEVEQVELALSVSEMSASVTVGESPADQTFEVWGTGALTYSISDNAAWLSCSPISGSISGEHDSITASFASSGLPVGSYTGLISIASAEASNSPQTIEMVLEVEGSIVLGIQTGWLLRTSYSVDVTNITTDAASGSTVHVWDTTENFYYSSSKTRAGWMPNDLVVYAGEQFVFEMPGGGDGYLAWPYAYVDDWRLTAPAGTWVSGDVLIEWEAFNVSNIPGNLPPNYAVWVMILSGTTIVENIGLIWEAESVAWDSRSVSNGNYTIKIWVLDSPVAGEGGAEVATITKQITVENSGIGMGVSVSKLAVATPEGSSPVDQWFEIWGIGSITYSISDEAFWLSCSPSSGSSGGEHDTIIASFTSAGLPVGSYTGLITVASAEAVNSPKTIEVVLEVEQVELALSTLEMDVTVTEGGSPANRTFEVWGTGALAYSIFDNVSWLSCSPLNGLSSGEHDTITVSFDSSGLSEGSYPAWITVASDEASNSPQTIEVVLEVESTIVPGTQTGWLLRTDTTIGVEEIGGGTVPADSKVYVWEASAYTVVTKSGRGGWSPAGVVVNAGQQFVFEWAGGGNDEYLGWPYAYVGDWRMTDPSASYVAGDVLIEWSAFKVSDIPGNPPPNYAAWVFVSGDDVAYDADLGLIWETESVVWHSQAAPSGNYTIDVIIGDPPIDGSGGVVVATIAKQVYHVANPIDGQKTETIDHVALSFLPDSLYVGSNTFGNAMMVVNGGSVFNNNGVIGYETSASSNSVVVTGTDSEWSNSGGLYVGGSSFAAGGTGNSATVTNGGTVSASSVTVYVGNVLHLQDGGTLTVTGDFDAGQGGFDYSGGSLEIGGTLSGMSELPAGNRLEVVEVVGDLTVYGIFSPGSSSGGAAPQSLGMVALAESGSGAVINGALALEAGGSLEMEIGGYGVGTEYDHLAVAGLATLEGTLDVVLVDGFMPTGNRSFDLFDWDGGINGSFSAVNLPAIPFGLLWNTNGLYSTGEVSVELSMVDSDVDGMVDSWEYLHFGGNVSPAGNPDLDPHDNLAEYISGSDPTNVLSYLSITNVALDASGFVVQWDPPVSGRWYGVSWTENLTNGFQTLEAGIEFPQNSYTDTLYGAEGQGFYRVDVQLK